ncbi:dienelactone hydrolase [Spinellus fusiger]|nr:dienelactone hydrolase [Spinellus fusiger]
MSFTKACCTLPLVASEYTPTGVIEDQNGVKTYSIGPKGSKKAIIVIYDIFGFSNNAKQFCDALANYCGYNVIMPDYMKGDYWTAEKLEDKYKFMAWVTSDGTYQSIKPDIEKNVQYLESQGVESIGIVGFCWGAKVAVQATTDFSILSAASLIHPSFIDVKDAEKAGAPILALPSRDEVDMTEYMEVLAKKPFGDKCQHHLFADMHHGFACARGDWSDELNAKRAGEAIKMTGDFFEKNL